MLSWDTSKSGLYCIIPELNLKENTYLVYPKTVDMDHMDIFYERRSFKSSVNALPHTLIYIHSCRDVKFQLVFSLNCILLNVCTTRQTLWFFLGFSNSPYDTIYLRIITTFIGHVLGYIKKSTKGLL